MISACCRQIGAMIRCKISVLLVIALPFLGAQTLLESTVPEQANSPLRLTERSTCDAASEAIRRSIALGALDEAERAVRKLPDQAIGAEARCAAALLGNVSAAMGAAGRLTESQALASKALTYLDRYPPESPVRAVPLYVLASVQVEQGMTGRARETYRRMQRISGANPGERSLIHATGAALSEIEGRWDEAKSEYRQAATALASAGKERSAETAGLLAGLASVHVNEHQYLQALAVINQALTILETATDAVPLDRIKFLNLRGVILGARPLARGRSRFLRRLLVSSRAISSRFYRARRLS
jgi:tetratricopeptide (TPR) repeat protein